MANNSPWKKFFNSSEELISMFLGLIIVVVIVGLVFNYFQRKRGTVNLAGVTDQKQLQLSDKGSNSPTLGLKAPITSEPASAPKKGSEYTVQKNDSLWKIAVATYGSGYNWTDIASANKLKNPGVLYTGQKLTLPDVPAKTLADVKPKTTIVPKVAAITAETYIVVKGDNLWKIAVRKYADGFRWTSIYNANKSVIKNPRRIVAGMKLTLPAKI